MLNHRFGISKRKLVGGFDPSTLGLALDLRMPNSPLSTDEDFANNGMIVFDLGVSGQLDISAILDQSQGLNKTIRYQSDFSAGRDGFIIGPSSPATAVDGNIDGIGGYDDVLRITMTNTNGYQYVRRSAGFAAANIPSYHSLEVYIPSSNSVDMGVWFGGAYAASYVVKSIPKDQWVTITGYSMPAGTYIDLGLVNASTGSPSFTPGSGDVAYFKNVQTYDVSGYDFIQTTPAAMSHWDNADFSGDSDGTDDYWAIRNITGFNSAYGSDSQGMFTCVVEEDEGLGVENRVFTLGDATGVTGNIAFRILSSNELAFVAPSGSANWGNISAYRGGRMKIHAGWDGSEFHVYINGDKLTDPGTQSGWLTDITTKNTYYLGTNRVLSGFYQNGYRHFSYMSGRVLTPDEIANYDAWIDSNWP